MLLKSVDHVRLMSNGVDQLGISGRSVVLPPLGMMLVPSPNEKTHNQ